MKHLVTTVLTVALMSGSMGIASLSMAEGGMHGKGHHMQEVHDSHDWKSSLTDEQRKQVDKLKLDYKKKVYPLKTKIKQAKVDLALLVTADKPDQKAINKQIDDILKLKGEKMRLKAAHKIEVRKLLNDEQRVKFDLRMLKKAYKGKKCKGHH